MKCIDLLVSVMNSSMKLNEERKLSPHIILIYCLNFKHWFHRKHYFCIDQ